MPIDHKDPSLVLYLPLWYPYSDMTGSTIYSYDRNRHTGTVTDATWGIQGRTFDGTGDYISIAHNAVFDITSALGIIIWFTCTNVDNYRSLLNKNDDGADAEALAMMRLNITDGFLMGRIQNAAAALDSITGSVNLADSAWHCAMFGYDASNLYLYVDGAQAATPVAKTLTPATNAKPVYLSRYITLNERYLVGKEGEVLIYNRLLSLAEYQNLRLLTKWRYIS